jgi:hypothetical protein
MLRASVAYAGHVLKCIRKRLSLSLLRAVLGNVFSQYFMPKYSLKASKLANDQINIQLLIYLSFI